MFVIEDVRFPFGWDSLHGEGYSVIIILCLHVNGSDTIGLCEEDHVVTVGCGRTSRDWLRLEFL